MDWQGSKLSETAFVKLMIRLSLLCCPGGCETTGKEKRGNDSMEETRLLHNGADEAEEYLRNKLV